MTTQIYEQILCEKCGKYYSSNVISRHQRGKNCKIDDPNKIIIKRDESWKVGEDQYKCPDCGEIHCKSGIVNHIRLCRDPNQSELGKWSRSGNSWNRGLTKETDERVKKRGETFSNNVASGKTVFKGHKITKETRKNISKGRIKYLREHPEYVSFKHGLSYPEKYFKDIFEKENINLKFHLRLGSYELDFYNEEKGIAIEIDGEQHYRNQEAIDHDKKRTEYLETLGWKVIRIRWAVYQQKNNEEKHQFIQELKNILENSKNIEDISLLLRDNRQIKEAKHKKEVQQNKEKRQQKFQEYKTLILASNIDFQKFGWVEKVKNILGVSHTQVIRIMKNYMLDFYNQCYHINSSKITSINNL